MHPVPGLLSAAQQLRPPPLLMQAIFNFMSCSAVAMAKMYGGSNALLVTGLIMVAHMVSCLGNSNRHPAQLLHFVADCTLQRILCCTHSALCTRLPLRLHKESHLRLCAHCVHPCLRTYVSHC